jgi:hypothetical protein
VSNHADARRVRLAATEPPFVEFNHRRLRNRREIKFELGTGFDEEIDKREPEANADSVSRGSRGEVVSFQRVWSEDAGPRFGGVSFKIHVAKPELQNKRSFHEKSHTTKQPRKGSFFSIATVGRKFFPRLRGARVMPAVSFGMLPAPV